VPERQEAVMARMNWDRVRKETQARRSGSEWVGSDDPGLGPTSGLGPSSPTKGFFEKNSLGRMPGCACRKTVGFLGQHKKFCPLRQSHGPVANPPTTRRPHREYPDGIKKQLSALRDFLSSLQANADHRGGESHQNMIRRLIQVLQGELHDPIVKSDLDH
jgi:hypothetical protein